MPICWFWVYTKFEKEAKWNLPCYLYTARENQKAMFAAAFDPVGGRRTVTSSNLANYKTTSSQLSAVIHLAFKQPQQPTFSVWPIPRNIVRHSEFSCPIRTQKSLAVYYVAQPCSIPSQSNSRISALQPKMLPIDGLVLPRSP